MWSELSALGEAHSTLRLRPATWASLASGVVASGERLLALQHSCPASLFSGFVPASLLQSQNPTAHRRFSILTGAVGRRGPGARSSAGSLAHSFVLNTELPHIASCP
mmetsp:Transcript_23193/g.68140  ORF Transcript_23193/g.68140 Transcript_23193/m.68140 type:complete len:107 (-) Transcript_23193:76-396(-)